jgi:hypothetical protein
MTVRVEREAYSLPVFDSAALHTVKFAAPASPNLEVFGLPDSVQQFGSLFRLAVPPIRDRQGFELCSSISRRCRFRFSRRTPSRARTRGTPYKLIRKGSDLPATFCRLRPALRLADSFIQQRSGFECFASSISHRNCTLGFCSSVSALRLPPWIWARGYALRRVARSTEP